MNEKIKNVRLPWALEQELKKAALGRPSWESRNEGIHERVNFDDTIWGFNLAGGSYYNTPLRVTQVKEDSRAEHAGIKVGDVLRSINAIETSTLTVQEAHDIILESGLEIKLNFTAPDVEETTYYVYQDELEEQQKNAKSLLDQKRNSKRRKFTRAKVNDAWSLAWPCSKKRDVMYKESNCFLVPSAYEAKYPNKIYEIGKVKTVKESNSNENIDEDIEVTTIDFLAENLNAPKNNTEITNLPHEDNGTENNSHRSEITVSKEDFDNTESSETRQLYNEHEDNIASNENSNKAPYESNDVQNKASSSYDTNINVTDGSEEINYANGLYKEELQNTDSLGKDDKIITKSESNKNLTGNTCNIDDTPRVTNNFTGEDLIENNMTSFKRKETELDHFKSEIENDSIMTEVKNDIDDTQIEESYIDIANSNSTVGSKVTDVTSGCHKEELQNIDFVEKTDIMEYQNDIALNQTNTNGQTSNISMKIDKYNLTDGDFKENNTITNIKTIVDLEPDKFESENGDITMETNVTEYYFYKFNVTNSSVNTF